jgi:hypothetical protein
LTTDSKSGVERTNFRRNRRHGQSSQDALAQFRNRLEERVRASKQEPDQDSAAMAAKMQQFQDRKQRFDQIAPQLVSDVIRPRMAQLAFQFNNAALDDRSNDRTTCWFGYCERFPSSAKIEIAVVSDAPIENVVVRIEASIFPSYQRYEPHDKLVVPMAHFDAGQVTQWVEDRIMDFLDLRIDRGTEDFDD